MITTTKFMGTIPALHKTESYNKVDAHEGECFTIGGDTDGECFSVSSGEPECFWINRGEEDKEQKIPFKPEIDFGELGFINVKCIQAMGLNTVAVIGQYDEEGSGVDYIGVIARVSYSPSVSGGIGKLGGVEHYEPLTSYSIAYENVSRLDGWDITSYTASICIVAGTTYWLDSMFFREEYRDETYTVKAEMDTYYTEDSYLPSHKNDTLSNTGAIHHETFNFPFWDKWSSQGPVYEYAVTVNPISSARDIIFAHEISSGDATLDENGEGYEITGVACTDTCCQSFESCSKEVSNGVILGWCMRDNDDGGWGHTVGEKYTINRKRNNFTIISTGGGSYISSSVNISTTDIIQGFKNQFTHDGDGDGAGFIDVYRQQIYNSINCIGDTGILIPFYDSGIKLCFSGEFYGCVVGSSFKYVSLSGVISGEIDGANTTITGSTGLTADGTATIKQKDLYSLP